MSLDHKLVDIVETHNIEKRNNHAVVNDQVIDLDSIVSMNMWGLYPEFINVLEDKFQKMCIRDRL